MRNFEEELHSKINALEVKVDESNEKYTAVEINTHCDLVEKLFSEMMDGDVDDALTEGARGLAAKKYNALCLTAIAQDLAGYRNQLLEIEMLKESLQLNLIHVTTRYLITDAKGLNSPSGYHPTEHVFVQPNIAIQSDSLDNVPNCNVKLRAFDMQRGSYAV